MRASHVGPHAQEFRTKYLVAEQKIFLLEILQDIGGIYLDSDVRPVETWILVSSIS